MAADPQVSTQAQSPEAKEEIHNVWQKAESTFNAYVLSKGAPSASRFDPTTQFLHFLPEIKSAK